MKFLAPIFTALVALEHIYILVLEMFFWESPKAMSTFHISPELASQTVSLAANQGLYNGFLAAGLIWGLAHPKPQFGKQIQLFFIICIIVAAIFGSLTATPSIIIKQGLPAILALTFHIIQGQRSKS